MDDETRELARAVRRFLDDVVQSRLGDAEDTGPPLSEVVDAHLGTASKGLPVVREEVPDHQFVDLDIALELLSERGGGGDVVGVGGGEQRNHHGFADLLSNPWARFGVGAVDRVNLPTGPASTRRAVGFGVRLLRFAGTPLAVLQRAAQRQFGLPGTIEVVCPDEEVVASFLAEVRRAVVEHSVLRGQVLSFSGSPYEPHNAGITFLPRPRVEASDVVLPPGALERIARHVVDVGTHARRLTAAGQHLKRGVLLYGPPGTGKTLTVRHLVSRAEGTTVVLLAGQALAHVTTAAHLARAMQPAIVVLEDCDLVAEDRGSDPGERPLLFQLLDAMDGLDGDADVAFLLTTNRADLLERALAQRPGRVDLAVHVPLPDRAARLALFRLYARGLPVSEQVLAEAADRAEGVTASFARELLRRAVLVGAEAGHDVRDDDVRTALDELLSDAEELTRSLLGSQPAVGTESPA
ncbi:AAA family ATPase [Kineococcus sp. SYSU DK001]|uniref:AAA family ATPase n=1 Tax=Kineococcus sp. SYSU DK001 TaxID=3383122 RepID=UPI003D7E47B0